MPSGAVMSRARIFFTLVLRVLSTAVRTLLEAVHFEAIRAVRICELISINVN